MLAFLKIKPLLLGALLASPPLAAWALRGGENKVDTPAQAVVSASPAEPVVRIPVEIVAKGSSPEWVQVEVRTEAVPEPGVLPLAGLPILLALLRRRR